MFTSKEIRQSFRDATIKVPTGHKGRCVTPDMMERDEIFNTIKKVRKGLTPATVVSSSPRHVLIRTVK